MSYVLGTTEERVRWYQFDRAHPRAPVLHDMLDLRVVTSFPDRESAKAAAQAAGLKTWRYVKV